MDAALEAHLCLHDLADVACHPAFCQRLDAAVQEDRSGHAPRVHAREDRLLIRQRGRQGCMDEERARSVQHKAHCDSSHQRQAPRHHDLHQVSVHLKEHEAGLAGGHTCEPRWRVTACHQQTGMM